MPPAATEVWSVDLVRATPVLLEVDRSLGLTAPDDHDKVAAMADRERAERRLAATIALRLLIERRHGSGLRRQPFVRAAGGKPELPGTGCHFSLAHTTDRALVALAATAVGIDLEAMREPAIDPLRRQRIETAAVELAGGRQLPAAPAPRFLQAWTRLEALAKADGMGIGRVLTLLGVAGGATGTDGEPADPRLRLAQLAARLAAHDVCDLALGQGHAGAVAGGGAALAASLRELPSERAGLEALLRPA